MGEELFIWVDKGSHLFSTSMWIYLFLIISVALNIK